MRSEGQQTAAATAIECGTGRNGTAMNVASFLDPTDVLIEGKSFDKKSLLKELSRRAAAATGLAADAINQELLKREELGSTGMGGGIAIPHTRIAGLARPFGCFLRLADPIEFDAIDGRAVDLIFLLLLPPASEGEQLNVLACVARKLRDPDAVAKLREATDSGTLYRVVTAAEKTG